MGTTKIQEKEHNALAPTPISNPEGLVCPLEILQANVFLRLNDKSRMKRELHVRFCEGFGVKLPLPTRRVSGEIEC